MTFHWCIIFALLSTYTKTSKILIAAHLAFRHGNRTATATVPNNNYKGWDNKLGQLTNEGKMTEYNLGFAIKDRYWTEQKLINESYITSEVTIRSSPSDRCLMSAQLQAASMYPPIGDEIWNNNLIWQPLPIHTTKNGEDYLLRNFDVDCPVMRKLKDEVRISAEYKQVEANAKDFIEDASVKAGKPYTLDNLWELQDVISTQYENKKPIPDWADETFRTKLHSIAFSQGKLVFYSQNTQLKRLLGGYLLNTIATNLKRMTSMSQDKSLIYVGDEQEVNKKLYLYSTHDLVVVGLMNVLDIPYDDFVPYGVAISVELYKDSQLGYIIEVYMRNNSAGFSLVPLKLCPYPCTMESFMKNFEHQFVVDLKAECCPIKTEPDYLPGFAFFVAFSAILIVVIIILLKFPPKLNKVKSALLSSTENHNDKI